MQENMGPRDRALRTLLAVLLAGAAILWAADLRRSAPAAIAAMWLAGTVLTCRCPLYHLLGRTTASRAPARRVTRGPPS